MLQIAEAVARGLELDRAERDRAVAFFAAYGDDVAAAVTACPKARWLGALADTLDQRLVWWNFRTETADAILERAAASRRMEAGERVPSRFSEDEVTAAAHALRSGDAGAREAAHELLDAWQKETAEHPLSRAIALEATDEMLDAAIEMLRGRLEVARMVRALAALPATETRAAFRARRLRERDADLEEIRALQDSPLRAGLFGAAHGRSMRGATAAELDRAHAARRAGH